jgi:hypothetical protein
VLVCTVRVLSRRVTVDDGEEDGHEVFGESAHQRFGRLFHILVLFISGQLESRFEGQEQNPSKIVPFGERRSDDRCQRRERGTEVGRARGEAFWKVAPELQKFYVFIDYIVKFGGLERCDRIRSGIF